MALTPQNVVAWHDRTPGEHADLVKKWSDKKFRTLSLSLYGNQVVPLYAAVMVKRPQLIATKQVGPVDQAGMQKAFDDLVKKGWGPYILTATGSPNGALFGAVFTPQNPIGLTRLNLSGKQFSEECGRQQEAGNILLWADAFGSIASTRYTAIWGPNPSRQAWSCDAIDEADDDLQARFEALRATWARPAHISVTPTGRHLELFVDSTIGSWSSKIGMTSLGYQKEFEKQIAEKRLPIRVSAQQTPTGTRFAAIFATREETDQRGFRAKGPRTVAEIDAAMETYLRDHNLRGAALAITRGTKLLYAKGYTFAESGYPDVQPTTLFRQASVSKTFTAVALWRLMQLKPNDVKLTTTMQSILKLKQLDGKAPKDSDYGSIRLRHLLESTSGLDQGTIWRGEEAAKAAGSQLPATHDQIARYSASFDLSGTPGSMTNVVYGNYDYFMLSRVVAKLAGAASFEAALNDLVLKPLKCTRTRSSVSLVGSQPSDEARYHMRVYNPKNGWAVYPFELGRSQKAASKPVVASHYGSWDVDFFDGCGGLSSAVVDVARLAAMFSDRVGNPVLSAASVDSLFEEAAQATDSLSGPDAHGYHGFDWAVIDDADDHVYRASKGGWLPAQGTVVTFSTGGFGYVIAQNGNKPKDVKTEWLKPVAAIAEARSWPAKDLFPDFGMPTLADTTIKIVVPKAVKRFSTTATEEMVQRSMGPKAVRVLPRVVRTTGTRAAAKPRIRVR